MSLVSSFNQVLLWSGRTKEIFINKYWSKRTRTSFL